MSFYAELHGLSTKEAYKEILDRYGVKNSAERKDNKKAGIKSYTLSQYAFEKRLPEEWLRDSCKLETGRDRDGTTYLKIPYMDQDGRTTTWRKRYANKDFRWRTGSSGKIGLYGEWRLQDIRAAGYAALVEGESDSQSMWQMGISALGVPGASMFKASQAGILQDLKLYLHQEPDHGGETFLRKVVTGLRDGGFIGEVYRWSCSTIHCKDPSEVYMKFGAADGGQKILALIKRAEKIDLDEPEVIPEAAKGAPVNLRQPEGWIYSDKGISKIDEKTYSPRLVCRTPIILTQRLKSIETGEEKIEIAFKRDGEWKKAIFPRSIIFTARSITALADLGCTITSENANGIVQFLAALEAENIDMIQKADSTSTFGWQPGKRFIPGMDRGIVLDIDPSQRSMAQAYCQQGSLEGWIETMAPHRCRDKFRFILAASFAAPLLRIIRQRIFFVYNWGGSKGGKAQPLNTKIITPFGYTTMGELKVGSRVIGGDGKAHKVTAIFPQGIKEVYELTFSDGTKTRCCKEHLWTVTTETRRKHRRGYTVMNLSEMIKKPIKKGKSYNFRIPVCSPVQYDIKVDLKIDPYLLGALIGDGCITKADGGRIFFNNSEQGVIQRVKDAVKKIGGHLRLNPYSTNQYEISGTKSLKTAIVGYGINLKSGEKFIPKAYLIADIESRKNLLSGLMDTDGNVDKESGSFKYSTTSARLAEDIQTLCRSLGYRTTCVKKKHTLQKSAEFSVTISTDEWIFKSEKHCGRVPAKKRKSDKHAMSIVEIKYVGREECQCIMVDSKEHTYLCDDFIVTHNTAALKAALSAWGDPERLMVSFNATQVGLERTASFYCDLPLGIDERQLAGKNQERLEAIIYMIASGTGKTRGAKGGGLQITHQWRTVALATGEEPLSTDTSQTGVSTRVLEIYGGPFDDEKSASLMHQQAGENCGYAGPEFVKRLVKVHEARICELYDKMLAFVGSLSQGKSGSHVSGIAAVALADALVDAWFFKGPVGSEMEIGEGSWERAKRMAAAILQEQMSAEEGDVNENAVQFIVDWVLGNQAYFGDRSIGTCLGMMSESGNTAYIFPSALNQMLSKAGYSPKKTLKYMADRGIIATTKRADRGNGSLNTVVKKFDNRSCRFVEFHIGDFAESHDPIDYDDENDMELQDGFEPIEDHGQIDLPFS